MRFGDREGPRGAFVQPVSGETWPGCGHFITESAARQVRSREKQKAGTKNPCLGVWYGSCGGKLSLESLSQHRQKRHFEGLLGGYGVLPKLVEFEGLACVEGVLLALVADDALTVQGENQSLAGGACSERPVPFSWQICSETVHPATGRFSSAK